MKISALLLWIRISVRYSKYSLRASAQFTLHRKNHCRPCFFWNVFKTHSSPFLSDDTSGIFRRFERTLSRRLSLRAARASRRFWRAPNPPSLTISRRYILPVVSVFLGQIKQNRKDCLKVVIVDASLFGKDTKHLPIVVRVHDKNNINKSYLD